MFKELRNVVLGIMARNPDSTKNTDKAIIPKPKKKLSSIENILHGEELQEEVSEIVCEAQDEMMRTAYFLTRADRKNCSEADIFRQIEKNYKEKLAMKREIKFEFIPKRQAYRNMRSFLDYTGNNGVWKQIRDDMELKNNCVCEICGNSSKEYGNGKYNYHTQCHEVWEYTVDHNKTPIQKLIKLESLCVYCHSIKHLNQYENTKTYFNLLINAYAEINNITVEKALEEYKTERDVFMKQKDTNKYLLDLSYLSNLDIPDLNDMIQINKLFDCHYDTFNSFIEMRNLYRNLERDENGKALHDEDEEQMEK